MRLAVLAPSLLAAACGGETADVSQARPPAVLPAFETRDVVRARIAALEAELVASRPLESVESVEPGEREHVRGLAALVAGEDRGMRAVALEDALAVGDACVPELAALARDGGAAGAAGAEREAAVELLGALDTVRAAEELLLLLETAEEPWLRAHAAWRLDGTTQDWTLPRLVLRMKYETDHETVVWLSRTLATLGNFTGLGVLHVVATTSPDELQRSSALARMQEIAAAAGFEDPDELRRAWEEGGEEALFRPPRSPRLELEVFRWIAGFDEFQLRGVDDGRFLLARLGPRAAEWMGEALRDKSRYVRVHTAQSLQRMGRRARPAAPALVELLADPEAGPQAAEAFGAMAFAPAEAALAARLSPEHEPELRLACARALGVLAGVPEGRGLEPRTLDSLRALLAPEESAELREAARASLRGFGPE